MATTIIEFEIEWLSFDPAKMRHCMFGNSCLTIHTCHLKNPQCTLKLWLNPTAGLYPGTMTHRKYQGLTNPILPPTALGDCCTIIYFAKHPSSTPYIGSSHILRAPVNYA